MLNKIDLLGPLECANIVRKIWYLREFWTHRHVDLPFFTLGSASYLDAVVDKQKYYTQAKISNQMLSQHFADLYIKLYACLATALKAPVAHFEKAALPGFHIFLAHKAFQAPMGSVHTDLQYRSIDWPVSEPLDDYPLISFTLALALPQGGGGLNLWDVHLRDLTELSEAECLKLFETSEPSYCEYQVGTLVIHSGHQVHQIASGKNMVPSDRRITLQGHALFYEGTWHLYW